MILINTLSLAMKFYNQPDVYTEFLNVLNIIFTVFFTLEFVFKLGAFRFKVRMKKIGNWGGAALFYSIMLIRYHKC